MGLSNQSGDEFMAYNYTECNRDQLYLLPPSMKEWLPEDHLAWFLIDAVGQMDLSAFHAAHRADGKGQKAHHPEMMLAVLLYAYCQGERSSRRIERHCLESVPYRILAADTAPDHCAFARFRQRHTQAMKSLFVEILRLCAEAGLVKAGKVNLDGTKMKANASLAANRTEEALAEEIEKMLSEAEVKDAEEDMAFGKDRRGDELPENLRSRNSRRKRLEEARQRLERERLEAEEAQRRKLEERAEKEEATGKKTRGKPPKGVEGVRDEQVKRKANTTAPETRIMKSRSGYLQGLNAQAVCTDDQIIMAADVTDQENDQGLYHPMMAQAQENATAVLDEEDSRIEVGRSDAGYCNEADLEKECGHEILMATQKDWKRRKEMREAPPPRGRIPKNLSATERMERKLRTKQGSEDYKKRAQTIEPVFGQIKSGRGIDSFYGRELVPAKGEWDLICGTHNLLKLFGSLRAARN
jgi:transposase